MDVTHPGSKPLDADQLSLLETFRGKVDSRITNHGLTAADVQMFVDEIKKHPDVSVALLDAVRGEVATLMQGQRFSFDFVLMPVRLRPDAIWAFPFSSPARRKPLGSAGRCL